jgi:hypothetical protein
MAKKGELSRTKLVSALRNGLRYFKKLNKNCKVTLPKVSGLAKSATCGGTVEFDYTVYGVSATLTATVVYLTGNRAFITFDMHGGKAPLSISDNDFNYKHKNFFIKKGNASATYIGGNAVYRENDVTTIMKVYADNMLKGDLYEDWKCK